MPSPAQIKHYGRLARAFRGTVLWHDLTDNVPFAVMNEHEANHFLSRVTFEIERSEAMKLCRVCNRPWIEWSDKENPAGAPGLSSAQAA